MFACLERQVVCSFELNSRMWVLFRNIPKLIHDSTESRVSSRTSASLEEQFMDPKYDMQENFTILSQRYPKETWQDAC